MATTRARGRPGGGSARNHPGETLPASAELPLRRTSFVGRRDELALIKRTFGDSALVTLTGAAGAGKTRLALEAAQKLARAGDIRFVDLAALTSPERVATAIAAALAVRESHDEDLIGAMVTAVGRRPLLLVVDNCEHVLEAAADVAARLVARCPSLQVLATSRIPLRITGEAVIPVRPLPMDGATTLYADRARLVATEFRLTASNADAVSQICRRLDGLPLAIELAAAWTAVMSPSELLPLLDTRFDVLVGGARDSDRRQRTLRAAVDWSYDLLDAETRTLFRRLSLFRGSFTREAAAALWDEPAAASLLSALSSLCETSMVVVETTTSGVSRYRLLETLRDYGAGRLHENPDEERQARDRHLRYLTALAERTFTERMAGGAQSVVDVLEPYRADVRMALEWAAATDRESQLRLAGTLAEDFRRSLFNFPESRRLLDDALAGDREPSPHRARALVAAAYMALITEDEPGAKRLVADACRLYRELDDRGGEAWARLALGHVAWMEDDLATARRELTRSRELYMEAGGAFGANRALLRLGIAESIVEDVTPDAVEHLTVAASRADAFGDAFGGGLARMALGWALMKLGRAADARAALREAVRTLTAVTEPMVFFAIETLAVHHTDDPGDAIRLFGYARAVRQQHGLRPLRGPTVMNRAERELEERARAALGAKGAAQAEAEGRAMTPDEALALALEEPGVAQTAARRSRSSPLTSREREIAELVAQGETYREIAARLFLSVRTVEKHVDNALTALGLRNRAQLAAWMHAQWAAAKDT